jgi:hypothetical protein
VQSEPARETVAPGDRDVDPGRTDRVGVDRQRGQERVEIAKRGLDVHVGPGALEATRTHEAARMLRPAGQVEPREREFVRRQLCGSLDRNQRVDGDADLDGSALDPSEPCLSSLNRSGRIVARAAPGQEQGGRSEPDAPHGVQATAREGNVRCGA